MPSCSVCGSGEAPYRWISSGISEFRCARCIDDALPAQWLRTFLAGLQRPRLLADVCPLCGTQRIQLSVTGLVGCGLCYELFAETITEHFGL